MYQSSLNLQKCTPVCYEFWLMFFDIFWLMFFNMLFMFFLFCVFVFYFVYSIFFTVFCTVSSFVYSCLFLIFVQVNRPLPPGGNSFAVNKYHIININHTSLKNYMKVGIASIHVIDMDNFFQFLHSKKRNIVTFCSTTQSSRILKMRNVFSSIFYFLLNFFIRPEK